MKIIVVTRHPALLDLLVERNIIPKNTQMITHIDDPDILEGAVVVGVLPLELAARCTAIVSVPLALTPQDRGTELSLDRLREIAGDPVTYQVSEVCWEASIVQASYPYHTVWMQTAATEREAGRLAQAEVDEWDRKSRLVDDDDPPRYIIQTRVVPR